MKSCMIRATKKAWFRGPETSKKKKEKVQAREFHSFMILLVLLHAYLYYSSLTDFLTFCAQGIFT